MTTYTFKQLCDVVHSGLTEMFKPDSIGVEKFSASQIHFFTRCYSLILIKRKSNLNHKPFMDTIFRYNGSSQREIRYYLHECVPSKILEVAQQLKEELS